MFRLVGRTEEGETMIATKKPKPAGTPLRLFSSFERAKRQVQKLIAECDALRLANAIAPNPVTAAELAKSEHTLRLARQHLAHHREVDQSKRQAQKAG